MSLLNPVPQLPATLPDSWLDQIKAAAKQTWGRIVFTTVLSSSVVSAFVSFGGNYWLETRKADLDMKKQVRKDAVEAYGNLGKQIEDLRGDLESAVLTFEYAVNNGFAVKGSKVEYMKNVDNSIQKVTLKIIEVNKALQNVRIDDASIKQNTENVLEYLPDFLAECQTDKSALRKVINLFRNALAGKLDALKLEILKKQNSIPLQS
jgi:hypothetical protein